MDSIFSGVLNVTVLICAAVCGFLTAKIIADVSQYVAAYLA